MRKVTILLCLVSVFLVECRDTGNVITIKNMAEASMIFSFRGEVHDVASGADVSLTHVPNGTYNYMTITTVPAGMDKWTPDKNLSGTLSLYNNMTTVSVIYTSIVQIDSSAAGADTSSIQKTITKTYSAYATVTSSHSALSNSTVQ